MREEQSRLNIHKEKIKTRVSLVVPVEPFEGVLLVLLDLACPFCGPEGGYVMNSRQGQGDTSRDLQNRSSWLDQCALLHAEETVLEQIAFWL